MTTPHDADLLGQLAQLAQAPPNEDGTPVAIAVGTFAIYPSPDLGVVLVINVDQAVNPELLGPYQKKMGPALIRTVGALGESGSLFGMVKSAVKGGRRRKE